MMFHKRPSVTSISSSDSSSTSSSRLSTPSSASSFSAQSSSPLGASVACPDILEDEDEERPPCIEIGDEQIDDSPFDPSIPDEMYWQMMQQAASAPASPTSGSLHERIAKLLHSSRPRSSISSGTSDGPPPSSVIPWKSKFKKRKDDALQDGQEPTTGGDRRATIHEPAEVISCTKRPTTTLISLEQARAMDNIVHRLEGFEIAEKKGVGRS